VEFIRHLEAYEKIPPTTQWELKQPRRRTSAFDRSQRNEAGSLADC